MKEQTVWGVYEENEEYEKELREEYLNNKKNRNRLNVAKKLFLGD